jgi:hypothetical protein
MAEYASDRFVKTNRNRYAPRAVGLMKIKNINRYSLLAVGLMKIEN